MIKEGLDKRFAQHVRSSLFFAHIRAATGTAVQQSDCHPFRHGRRMDANGTIDGFRLMRRDLAMSVDPALYPDIEGSTDSECQAQVSGPTARLPRA